MPALALFLLWFQLAIPQERWLVVDRSGAIETFDKAPDLTPEQRERVLAVWAWSDRSVPRRIDPGKIGRTPLAVDGARLAVHVDRQAPGKAPSDLRLVAAPAEMWIALPEAVLPSWPVPADGRLSLPLDPGRPVRLRVLGRGEGSWWTDVSAGAKTAIVTTVPANGVDLQVFDPQGKPVKPILGTLQAPRGNALRPWAGVRGEEGRAEIAGLPDREEISLLLRHPAGAPLFLVGRPSSLPREVRLPAAAELKGRILNPEGAPLVGASIQAETWVSPDLPMMHRMMTRTDERGQWRLGGLPAGRVALTLRAARYVPVVDRFEIEPGERDLGDRRLEPGTELAVHVVDDTGRPIPGARVDAGSGWGQVIANGQGVALLSDLPQAPVDLRGEARHFLPGRLRLNPPFPEAPQLQMPRALTVVGRIVDGAGRPQSAGSVAVLATGCSKEGRLEDGGGFDLDLAPEVAGELVFRSPSTQELRVPLAPGKPGEIRDLGDLVAPTGRIVTGRVVRAADGTAVAGARIWTTRQGADGPDIAWATRDLLAATSGDDGRFELGGLLEGPLTLRVDAEGFARSQVSLTLDAFAWEAIAALDLGTVTLAVGTSLRIRIDPAKVEPEGAVARVDLGNRWRDADLLTAQVRNGSAVIPDVPSGNVTVTVLSSGGRLLCERAVQVPDAGGEQEVECLRPVLTVAGQVSVGGVPADGGSLLWQSAGAEVPNGLIQNHVSPGGLRQQQVAGLGRPQVDVEVEPSGRFETDQLTPGLWVVSWRPAAGTFSGSVKVQIPSGDHFETALPFAGLALAGRVTDGKGRPVEDARVRELASGAFAFTRADGGFVLAGLRAGKAQVQARLRDQASELREVAIASEEAAEPLLLVLGRNEAPALEVRVVDRTGAPVPGAFVFLEQEGKGRQLLTSAADGIARSTTEAPLPARVRAAALAGGVWGFGPWVSWAEVADGLVVALSGSGTLSVRTDRLEGLPAVSQVGGWDIGWLLRLLGAPLQLSSERPLVIGGLPEGRYEVALGSTRITVEVSASGFGEGRLDG
ncbi:MAG TPA: carboxypeptidase-like regulatory domain-containing protein [Thermoanaerobaculia bacterium]|jgi:hypothetical protein|nr:carboxypeptidase-like regulatory domain-containing protein [Thermoanaerobaculia bacterium]